MHASFILEPISYICLAVWKFTYKNYIIAILYAILDLAYYFAYYKKDVRYSAIIASTNLKILLKNILKVILTFILVLSFISIQIYIAIVTTGNNDKNYYLFFPLIIFQLYWLYFIAHYFLRVYVSTIITLDITAENEVNVAKASTKNSFCALGSICFGSLFTGFNYMIEITNLQSGTEKYRDYGSSFFYKILSKFVTFLLTLTEFYNDFVFPYIALCGTAYTNSLKDSFKITRSGENHMLNSSLCLQYFARVLALLYIVGLYILSILTKMPDGQSMSVDVALIFIGTFSVLLYLNMISSASKAFLFLHSLRPATVKDKRPKAVKAMRSQLLKYRIPWPADYA
ncbi:hypothetical protein COBT_002512 [Conglomerata obtusa]